jgi:hypothetical protein
MKHRNILRPDLDKYIVAVKPVVSNIWDFVSVYDEKQIRAKYDNGDVEIVQAFGDDVIETSHGSLRDWYLYAIPRRVRAVRLSHYDE